MMTICSNCHTCHESPYNVHSKIIYGIFLWLYACTQSDSMEVSSCMSDSDLDVHIPYRIGWPLKVSWLLQLMGSLLKHHWTWLCALKKGKGHQNKLAPLYITAKNGKKPLHSRRVGRQSQLESKYSTSGKENRHEGPKRDLAVEGIRAVNDSYREAWTSPNIAWRIALVDSTTKWPAMSWSG